MGTDSEVEQKEGTRELKQSVEKSAELDIKENGWKVTPQIREVKVVEWPQKDIVETKKALVSRQEA